MPHEKEKGPPAGPTATEGHRSYTVSNNRPQDERSQGLLPIKRCRDLLEWALREAGATIDGDRVKCPFHDDGQASGSIHNGTGDGACLYTCHACEWNGGKSTGDSIAVLRNSKGLDFEAACARLAVRDAGPQIKGMARKLGAKAAGIWPYSDEHGVVGYIVVRYESNGGSKEYRPFHRTGTGWSIGGPRGPLPLYRLPAVLAAIRRGERIYVVEGEKCADALWRLGLPATTSSHGAKAARRSDWSVLGGCDIVVIPDNDEAGRKYAQDVAGMVSALNPPAGVRIVELDDLPVGGDVADFVEDERAGELDAEQIRSRIEALADHADCVPGLRSPIEKEQGTESNSESHRTRRVFSVISIGDFLDQEDEEISWVVEGLLPSGGVSILATKPKVGKSTLARTLILSVARGEPFLNHPTRQGTVIYVCHEDLPKEVRKSFKKLGLTRDDRVFVSCGIVDRNKAVQGLRELIDEYAPVLVVVDTIGKFLPIKDFDNYGEVNRAFGPLLQVVRDAGGCHVMFLHHSPKAVRGGGDDVLGSTAFFGNVDTVINMSMEGQARRRFASAEQQRYGAHLARTELTMEAGTDRIIASPDGSPGSPDGLDRIRAEIRRVLEQGTKSRTEIKNAVCGRDETVMAALDAMVEAGDLAETGQGVRGDAKRYSLRPSPLPTSDSVPCSHPIEEPKTGTESDAERAFREVLEGIPDEVWRKCTEDEAA